jgi:hypothetical protein
MKNVEAYIISPKFLHNIAYVKTGQSRTIHNDSNIVHFRRKIDLLAPKILKFQKFFQIKKP